MKTTVVTHETGLSVEFFPLFRGLSVVGIKGRSFVLCTSINLLAMIVSRICCEDFHTSLFIKRWFAGDFGISKRRWLPALKEGQFPGFGNDTLVWAYSFGSRRA